jgi:CBS domain-containing protein
MHMPVDLERLTVAQAMRDKVVTITPGATLGEAARKMRDELVTALPVVDPDNHSTSIITERDVGRAVATDVDARECKVADFLTADVIAATSDWTLERAARTMAGGGFRHLLVFEHDKMIGILSMRDIVRAWVRETEPSASELAAEAQTGEIPTLGAAHKYLYTLRRGAKQHLVAAKCPCQWEWLEVLEGQLEDRPELDEDALNHLWELREPCPALHAEGGGAD